MKRERTASFYLRWLIIGSGLLVPTLILIPFGSIWLWQKGYLLYWAIGACTLVAIGYFYQRSLLKGAAPPVRDAAADQVVEVVGPEEAPEPAWSPAERRAWDTVLDVAKSAKPEMLASRDSALALGLRTIEAVAKRLHPEVAEPLWQFTVPEVLALVEQVSRRLRPFIIENIPLGDQLTVAQVRRIYGWRSAVDTAYRFYDLWRILRFANPVTAATHEMREVMTKQIVDWGKEQVGRRLAEAYVQEVGRAAIDLYGGRLRISPEAIEAHVSAASTRDREQMVERRAEPLRILVIGQTSVGKSSLINALVGATHAAIDALPTTEGFDAYELSREGLASALIVDSPGLSPDTKETERTINAAADSDLVLWVCSAARADREVDRQVMMRFRKHFAERLDRTQPPLLVALTHVDRLRPVQEWAPPYDLNGGKSEKAASIRAAMSAVAEELGLDRADIVPLSLAPGQPPYNVDPLWAEIVEHLPEAKRAQLLRSLAELKGARDWKKVWRQATNAGRVMVRGIRR